MRKFCIRLVIFLILAAAFAAVAGWLFRFEIQYVRHRRLIETASARYPEVPAVLIASVIWHESRFCAGRVGLAGEIGLMQVMPQSAREWAKAERITDFKSADLFRPEINVRAGTWYLARSIRRWSGRPGTLALALAEYNAGHSNAARWAPAGRTAGNDAVISRIDYPTTRRYVRNILCRYESFGRPWRLLFNQSAARAD